MTRFPFAMRAVAIVGVIALMSMQARADDAKSMDDQYQALATQRTKAELACDKAAKAMDGRESGYDEVNQSVGDLRNKIAEVFAKAIRTESAKAEGERNQNLIDELNDQTRQLDQDWQAYNRDQQKINGSRNHLSQEFNSQRTVFQGLSNQERAWKDGGLDLTALGSAYDAVTRAVDANSGKIQQLTEELKAKQTEWQAKLTAATKAVEAPK